MNEWMIDIDEELTYSRIGEDLTKARKKYGIFTYRLRKIIITQTIVMIFVHLFQGDFH